MTSSISERLEQQARALGFVGFGIAPSDGIPLAAERLHACLEEGRHGDMQWMKDREGERGSPKGLWPDVRSVIALGFPYTPPFRPNRHLGRGDMATISVYALGKDYHDIIKPRLKQLARWFVAETGEDVKVFVDTAPVMEKPLAEAAGLGWQGKHSVLISRKAGTWMFLGAIYTTAELPPYREEGIVGSCGSCTACIDACPTGAIIAPFKVDARRCISYLTIEHKGPVDPELRPLLGNRIFGCDDCLAACPWNSLAQYPSDPTLLPRAELTAPKLADFLKLDDASFRQIFSGSPVKRTGRNRFIRNCLYAAGNSNEPSLVPLVEALLADPDATIRDAASWALARLKKGATYVPVPVAPVAGETDAPPEA